MISEDDDIETLDSGKKSPEVSIRGYITFVSSQEVSINDSGLAIIYGPNSSRTAKVTSG